jgi:NhaP-type Na+/H+ or K+/H+ antiporter
MVLALTLSSTIGIDKTQLLSLTFGVVFFSLAIQGSTMAALLKKMRLTNVNLSTKEYQLLIAKGISNGRR